MGEKEIACLTDLGESEVSHYSADGDYPSGIGAQRPGRVELDNGLVCSYRLGGAADHASDNGIVVYYCKNLLGDFSDYAVVESSNTLAVGLDTGGDVWMAYVGKTGSSPADLPPLEKVKVTKAYFAGWAD